MTYLGPGGLSVSQLCDIIGLITRVPARLIMPQTDTERRAGVWLVSSDLKWLQCDGDQAWAGP